jgi:hypothetical protein
MGVEREEEDEALADGARCTEHTYRAALERSVLRKRRGNGVTEIHLPHRFGGNFVSSRVVVAILTSRACPVGELWSFDKGGRNSSTGARCEVSEDFPWLLSNVDQYKSCTTHESSDCTWKSVCPLSKDYDRSKSVLNMFQLQSQTPST